MNARAWIALLLLPAGPALADGARLEYGYWNYSISGDVVTRGERIDLERDIGIEVHSKSSFAARWDTQSAWIPDFTADYLNIDAGGRRETTTTQFPFPPTTTVTLADASLGDVELTLRYPWRFGAASAWGGLTVKHLAGDLTTRGQSATQESRESVSETFPMIHGAVEYPLGDRFTLGASIDWISSGGSSALQWRAGADFRVWGPLGLTAAWQRRHYKVNTQNDALDATLDGGLLGICARW
jgi:hypothetical protein